VIPGEGGFGEDAYRYSLSSIDATGASYTFGGEVPWPPEAASQVTARADRRADAADEVAPAARHSGN
jgi:hypothetical protein